MNKVILVMDNPDECRNCPCFNGFYFGGYCGVIDKEIEYDYDSFTYVKPNWCPLKALPKKVDSWLYTNQHNEGVYKGWNACIDKILGND